MLNRRDFLAATGMAAAGAMTRRLIAQDIAAKQAASNTIAIDLGRELGSFPHYWENTAGSDRVAVGLREAWRQDLETVHRVAGIRSIRSHGLFNDEMGVCTGIEGHGLQLSFLYIDQVYDKMLEIGVRPFVELSFMPSPLASSGNTMFFYKGNVSPPLKWEYWAQLVQAYTAHCVKRYGIAEVSQWQFEVWNEPNINFWAGTQEQYFELYRQSAQAVKSVDRRLQVGGPSTAQMAWIPELIDYCVRGDVPIDFVTSHIYANDPQQNIFGKDSAYPFEQVMSRALRLTREHIQDSSRPDLPLLITEWSSQNPAFIAHAIKDCAGACQTMSYWTFDNVFEELGPQTQFINSQFGMIGQGGVARPSLHAFELLHRLGEIRLAAGEGPILATRRADGSHALLAWNLVPHKDRGFAEWFEDPLDAARAEIHGRPPLPLRLQLAGRDLPPVATVTTTDPLRGSALLTWEKMGRPQSPTQDQIQQLRTAAKLPEATSIPINSGELVLTLEPNAVVLIELG